MTSWSSQRQKKSRQPFFRLSLRTAILFFTLCIFLGAIVACILWHPFFHVDRVVVEGAARLDESRIREEVKNYLDETVTLHIPRKSYALVRPGYVREALVILYPGERFIVSTQFPDTLRVVVEEKVPSLIYDSGSAIFVLAHDGTIIDEVVLPELPPTPRTIPPDETQTTGTVLLVPATREERLGSASLPALPRVIDSFASSTISHAYGTNLLASTVVQRIEAWASALPTRLQIEPETFIFDDSRHQTMRVQVRAGYTIRLSLEEDAEDGIRRLESVFRSKPYGEAPTEYIDIRYRERVFWR